MGTYLQPSSIEHPVLDSQELLTIGTTTLSTCTLTSISLETRNSLITTLQCSTMTIVLSPLWSLDVIHGPSTSMTPTEDTPCACILRVQPSVLQASTGQSWTHNQGWTQRRHRKHRRILVQPRQRVINRNLKEKIFFEKKKKKKKKKKE